MPHLGKHQKEIIAALQAGAVLHCDGGMWGWTKEESGWIEEGRFVASSCIGLLQRGLVYEKERLPLYGAFGQDRVVYGLSEKGQGRPHTREPPTSSISAPPTQPRKE